MFDERDSIIFPILSDNEKGAKKLESICDECQIPIFFDKKKKVVKELNQEVIITKLGRMPAVIIVDKEGIIRYAYFGESMSDIPENQVLLDVLDDLND